MRLFYSMWGGYQAVISPGSEQIILDMKSSIIKSNSVTESVLLFESAAKGDCYEAAANLIWNEATGGGMNPFPDFNSVKSILVHAEVRGQGPLEGTRYGHAWVERGGKVFDYSNGKKLEVDRGLYYALGDVRDEPGKIYRYTGAEVKRWMQRTHHYGPWELKTESGL